MRPISIASDNCFVKCSINLFILFLNLALRYSNNFMAAHNELGVKGEITALEYLQKKGYTIMEINWRFKHAEVDIIAKQNNTIVFVEVKTRSTEHFGYPESAVDVTKQKNLALAADEYLERNNIEMDVRFDIISIVVNNRKADVYHLEDAFFPYDMEE